MRRRTSGVVLAAMVASLLPVSTATAVAQEPAPEVVISQVYGGGGNSGATYTHDFIELFNAGDAPADISNWSVQYAATAGTSWQVTDLGADQVLEPGQYLYVQQAAGAGGTVTFPADVEGSIAMAGANGKVALVDDTTALTGSCPLADTVDFVGYGTANCFEGSGATGALSNTTSAQRLEDGCVDTDDNAADFTVEAPEPRNSDSDLNPCGGADARLVISQLYGAGGNSGAVLNADYVELFNAGGADAELEGLSLQYGAAAGNYGNSAGAITSLVGTVGPGEYFLVEMAGGANGADLPVEPDQTNTQTNMAAANGKMALVDGTDSLACGATATPCDAQDLESVIDRVGFGTANDFEGSAAAPAPSTTDAIFRADDGCQDTDDNAADFSTGAPAPRNSESPTNLCTPATDAPIVTECPSTVTVARGSTTDAPISASDEDDAVTAAAITSDPVEGITLDDVTPAGDAGETLTGDPERRRHRPRLRQLPGHHHLHQRPGARGSDRDLHRRRRRRVRRRRLRGRRRGPDPHQRDPGRRADHPDPRPAGHHPRRHHGGLQLRW
jgi:predicted extracellular nuclease